MEDNNTKGTTRARLEEFLHSTRKRLVFAYERQLSKRPTSQWSVRQVVGPLQIAEAERRLGLSLPLDLALSYEVVAQGEVPLCGWNWWPLDEAVLKTRLMRTLAEMRHDAATTSQAHTPDGVKLADWHPGWVAIAESGAAPRGRLLCIDTAPERAEDWGQLIETCDPTWAPVDPQRDPPRRIDAGWLSYWQHLAVALEAFPAPAAVVAWREQPGELRLQIDGLHPLPGTEPELPSIRPEAPEPISEAAATIDLGDLLPTKAQAQPERTAWPRELRTTHLCTGEEVVGSVERSYGDACAAADWLTSFTASPQAGVALLLGHHGDGLTTLVDREVIERLATAHRRDASEPVAWRVDLGAQVNVTEGRWPPTLAAAIEAELARRHLPAATHAVLQAISDGRCVLVLDHVEWVAAHSPDIWSWPSQLPRAAAGTQPHRAHVLMLCADEFFESDDAIAHATAALRLSVAGPSDQVWLGTLEPVSIDTSAAWCAQAGLSLTDPPAHHRVWSNLGSQRAVAAKIQALGPLFQQAGALHELDGFAAWWQQGLPAQLGLDPDTLRSVAISFGLTELQRPEHASPVPPQDLATLVQHYWPESSPAQVALLCMAVRAALQLQRAGHELTLPTRRLWCAAALVEALSEGEVEFIGMVIGPGWRGTDVANAAAQAWWSAGNAAPPALVAEALQQEQHPEVAGALFRLACEFARELAATAVRVEGPSADAASRYTQHLHDMLALTCPAPLSRVRLAGASLRGASLRQLPLSDLDLSRADLAGADFTEAQLLRVRLDDAIADNACFDRAVLRDVSADRLIARRSRWYHTDWNRRWPTALLTDAESTIPGVRPDTSDGPFHLATAAGAPSHALCRLKRSPGGAWLAAITEDGGLGVWAGDTLTPAWHLPVGTTAGLQVLDFAFTHDGTRVITSHASKSLRSWSLREGRLLHEFGEVHTAVELLLVHPNGTHVVGYGGHQLAWCNPDLQRLNQMPATVPAGSAQGLTCAAIRLPAGDAVYANDSRSPSGLVEYRSNGPRRSVAWPNAQPWRIACTHDTGAGHDWLAVLDPDAVWLGNPDATDPPHRYARPSGAKPAMRHGLPLMPGVLPKPSHITELAFSPDGRWLICTGPGGPAIAIATHDGSVHLLPEDLSKDALCASFDAAGRLVLGGDGLRPCPLPDEGGLARIRTP